MLCDCEIGAELKEKVGSVVGGPGANMLPMLKVCECGDGTVVDELYGL